MANRRRRKRRRNPVALAEGTATADGVITLAVGKLKKGEVEVDRENRILRNVAFLTMGPAIGHGFVVDEVMLDQLVAEVKRFGRGAPAGYTHSWTDTIETRMGRAVNARREGDQVRGDIEIAAYADSSPRGKLGTHVLDLADEDPEVIGLSIRFRPGQDEERTDEHDMPLPPAARIKELLGIDFVGDPGANPEGLLSAADPPERNPGRGAPHPAQTGEQTMNEQLRRYLETLGLKAGASDEEAIAFWNTRKGAEKAFCDELAAKPPAKPAEPAPATPPTPPAKPAAPAEPAPEALTAAQTAGITAERERYKALNGIATEAKLGDAWVTEHVLAGTSVEDAKALALTALAAGRQPVPVGSDVHVGQDRNVATLSDGISDAICLRAGVKLVELDEDGGGAVRDDDGKVTVRKPHERAGQFRNLSLVEIGRRYLGAIGVPGIESFGATRVVDLMSHRRLFDQFPEVRSLAQGTGNFSNILANSMRKSLLAAYLDAASSWQVWARRTTTPDFKTITRAALSESPDLASRDEGGEINYVTLGDSAETYALVEYAGGIILTRRAVINDDLDAFGRIPTLQGNAARRKEDDVAYAIITANAAMADTGLLFNDTAVTSAGGHANHTDTGTALSVASLAVGETAMMVQKGPKLAAFLEIAPKFLLVPTAKKAVADQLINSVVDPSKTNAANNPYANKYQVVPSARLNADSTTAWYLFADYRDGQVDTIEVCFLAGEEQPVLKQETDFDTDDQKFAVRHTVAAKAIDWRGVYKNDGA